jgi:hypothetical protein
MEQTLAPPGSGPRAARGPFAWPRPATVLAALALALPLLAACGPVAEPSTPAASPGQDPSVGECFEEPLAAYRDDGGSAGWNLDETEDGAPVLLVGLPDVPASTGLIDAGCFDAWRATAVDGLALVGDNLVLAQPAGESVMVGFVITPEVREHLVACSVDETPDQGPVPSGCPTDLRVHVRLAYADAAEQELSALVQNMMLRTEMDALGPTPAP